MEKVLTMIPRCYIFEQYNNTIIFQIHNSKVPNNPTPLHRGSELRFFGRLRFACCAVIPAGIPLSSRRTNTLIIYSWLGVSIRLSAPVARTYFIIGPNIVCLSVCACFAFVCCREIKCINYGANIESGCVRAFGNKCEHCLEIEESVANA